MNLNRSIDQALTWLNHFDGPYADDPSLTVQIRDINNTQNIGAVLDGLVDKLLKAGDALGDQRLQRELLVLSGAAYFKKGQLDSAQTFFEDAIALYRQVRDTHREAVVAWMLGSCLWLACDCNQAAFAQWANSRSLFKMLAYDALRTAPDPTRLKWYLARITELSIWMARTPEEAHAWLNLFGASSLEPAAIKLRDRMLAEVANHRYAIARRAMSEMMTMARDTGDYQQLPEAYVESGLGEYQMGNLEDAARRFDEASQRYPGGSHRQAVARWMLGCVRWQVRGQESLAMRDWQQTMVLFERLSSEADRRADPTRRQWYQERLTEMQGAFDAEMNEDR